MLSNNTIAYDLGEGVTGSVEEQTAKVNTQVTLNDGAGITKEGETFGGWYVKQADDTSLVGTRYNGGATITMPNGNITLAPLWGHVGVAGG
ncbi:MAG: InlB B-repeat-containing protein [Eubacteriales bacterium]